MLITADSGGSNGSRLRLWKTELAALATDDRARHHRLPPAAGHQQVEPDRTPAVLRDRRNWRGRPLESHEVIIETLRATTTSTGLTVHAELDTGTYERGIKITTSRSPP